ncbi:MAG: MFS transporter [Candidatus Bathyarchaeia archaeon]
MSRQTLIDILEEASLSRFHYKILLIGCLVYAFTAMNVMLIAAVLTPIISEFKLDPLGSGLLLSVGYLGMFIGAITCGVLADRWGRKKTLIFTTTTMTAFTAANALAPDPLTMGLLRFLAGIGLGGALPQPGVYVSEYIPARYRGRFLGLVEASWVYGALLSLLFPYVMFPIVGWRLTFLVALVPIILVPMVAHFLPESLRYLQLKGRVNEVLESLTREGIIPKGFTETSSTPPRGRKLVETLKELWSKSLWKRTLLLWVFWAVLVYTYHGIFIWLPTIYAKEMGLTVVKSIEWTLIVTLAQVPGYYSAALLLDKVGRKGISIAYLAMAGLGSVFLGLSSSSNDILLWSIVISFFNLGAWSALYTYTPELYPTHIRGTGSGTAASIGRVAGIIAPTATPLLYAYGGLAAPFTVFALAHFLGAMVVAVLGIETKGKKLEEI